MRLYEIRILQKKQVEADIHSSSHLNDHAAIRRAMTLAKPGQAVEVWCGERCVYAGKPAQFALN